MWLYLDLDGIEFHFRVKNYRKSTREKWDVEWCKVDLTVQSRNWLNYQLSSEILLAYEVEKIRDKISDLLEDKIKIQEEMGFIEPDFTFVLNPKKICATTQNILMLQPVMKLLISTLIFKFIFGMMV